MKNYYDTTLTKVHNVFTSCKTEQHYDVAIKFASLYAKSIPKQTNWLQYNISVNKYIDRVIGYTAGRLGLKL